jgi:PAS domain-containing protein
MSNNNSRPMMQHAGNSNGMTLAPSSITGAPMPPQQHQHQHHYHQATEQSGLIYDLSSFDPLQAHALQLTASAGLTNLLTPAPAPTAGTGDSSRQQQQHQVQQQIRYQQPQHTQMEQQQQQIQQTPQAQQAQPQQVPQQTPYYYMQQPQTGVTSSLQPIAPATQATTVASGSVSQAPMMSQPAQNYILPATAQGQSLTMPANFQPHLHRGTLSTAGAPGTAHPDMLMAQHFHSVVAGQQQQQPLPLSLVPAIAPSKKRQTQESTSDRPAAKKKRQLSPSVVSSSGTSSVSMGQERGGGLDMVDPSLADPPANLESMTPAERRRYERNLREQQRSYRISQQIKELREVLTESNVPFKPNKYSILLSVVEYIKQLQSRAIMLDSEHQKLITTIRKTNEIINSGNTPSSADETEMANTTSASDSGSDNEMLFVQGLDYESVFDQCPAALGIAALDGRILECNPGFQLLLGTEREDLLKQSLFNLVRNHQDIFRAMAEMLKVAEEPANGTTPATPNIKNRYWSGPVISKRDTKVRISPEESKCRIQFVQFAKI